MKKLLIVSAALALATSSMMAQGVIAFANDSTTTVKFGAGSEAYGKVSGAAIDKGAVYSAALYWAKGTDPLAAAPTSWTQIGSVINMSAVAVGRFNGGAVTCGNDTAAGERAWFQIKVWESAFGASYDAASAAAAQNVSGVTRTAFYGQSTPFNVQTGGGTLPAGTMIPAGAAVGQTLAPFTVSVTVPEPSTIGLGLLGLAGLLALRRRS